MDQILSLLSSDDLTPHGYCLLWDPALIWSQMVTDFGIAAAYFAIPWALWIIAHRRPDLNPHGILVYFAAFIILCAMTHVIAIVTLWQPLYWLAIGIKAACAVISIITAVLVYRLLDRVLKIPRTEDLAHANAELQRLNQELERRVMERTKALAEANEYLVGAALEAREADRVKNDFLARVSHELRTPLNAIIGFVDLMRSGLNGQLSGKHQEYCESIQVASAQLLQEINDILDLERITDADQSFDPQPLDLRREVSQIVRLNQPMIAGARMAVEIDIPNDFEVVVDRRAIGTIIGNLVSNAIKYSPPGGLVRISAERAAEGGLIKVADRGFGIPEEHLEDIFQPFVRVHEREQPTIGGTGLGLPLVRLLSEAHGGWVSAESTVNQGTTLSVFLPDEPKVKKVSILDAQPSDLTRLVPATL